MKLVYFDHAATSWPKPPAMMEAMARFNDAVGANPGRSGHRLSIEAARVVYEARELAAEVLGGTDPLSIAFTKNATEALNCVLLGLLKAGDHVVVSAMEHNSVMRPLRFLERRGIELSVAPCSPAGELDPADAAAALKSNTAAIVVAHASNVTGTLLPVEALAAIAQDRGIPLIVDASQTMGSVPLDVVRSGIDIVCFTGHKSLLGPQGTGGFYVREDLAPRIQPLMRGGTGSASEYEEQPDFLPDRFESGTPNALGLAGLAEGIRCVLDTGVERIGENEMALTRLFLKGAAAIPGLTLYGLQDVGQRTAVVSFNIAGMSPSEVAFELDEQFGVLCRPGLHCAPTAHRVIGTFPEGTVRFSFGYSNTEEDVRYALEALAEIAGTSLEGCPPNRNRFRPLPKENLMTELVDAKGLACPEPVIRTKKALDVNNEVTVLVDNTTALENVKRLASVSGCAVQVARETGGVFRIELKKGHEAAACAPSPECACPEEAPRPASGPTIFVIASSAMGQGNDELGVLLMKAFIHTTVELEKLPDMMILYNTGVKLAAKESGAADDLKALEEKGVKILVCGTCINFFELTGKLGAGTVSNMYDIAGALSSAGRIVRP